MKRYFSPSTGRRKKRKKNRPTGKQAGKHTKQNKTKQNKTKQIKTKQNKTKKQIKNKTKQKNKQKTKQKNKQTKQNKNKNKTRQHSHLITMVDPQRTSATPGIKLGLELHLGERMQLSAGYKRRKRKNKKTVPKGASKRGTNKNPFLYTSGRFQRLFRRPSKEDDTRADMWGV